MRIALTVILAFVIGSDTPHPPATPVKLVVDTYYGEKVADPYRYLEKLNDPEVQSWMRAQDAYTRHVLQQIPGRQHLLERFRQLDDSAGSRVTSVYRLPGDVLFYEKRTGSETTARIYVRRGMDGSKKLLVDPSKVKLAPGLEGKGQSVILYFRPSPNGKYVAFGIAPGGAEDDAELHVVDAETGVGTGDVLPAAPFDVSWLPDSRSFAFVGLQQLPGGTPKKDLHSNIRPYLHVLGSRTNRQTPLFGSGVDSSIAIDPMYVSAFATYPGSSYAVGAVYSGDQRVSLYTAPVTQLGTSQVHWRKVTDFPDCVRDFAVHKNDLYLQTCQGAPGFKIVQVDAAKGTFASAKAVMAAGQKVIEGMAVAADGLYVRATDGATGKLLRVPYGKEPEAVDLPVAGNINSLIADDRVPGILFGLSAWTQASRYYSFDPILRKTTETKLQPVGPSDTPRDLRVEEVEARSHDGVPVPLTIVHRADMRLDGTNPTHLTGYGAYGISQDPTFRPWELAWFEQGAIEATCHVRGGGERGEDWHLAGKGKMKPNTWKDLIACAEYLSQKRYTSPEHLSVYGASAGGITAGRAITERPDLFGSAILAVPCSDMVRQETTSNGVPNIPEFGSTKTEEGFRALFEMSPYHHVKDGIRYPAVMVSTGINDPRVDAWQPAKMAARLQAATASGKPVLLRVDWRSGHGVGDTEGQLQQEVADMMSFDLWQLGAPGFQPRVQAFTAGRYSRSLRSIK